MLTVQNHCGARNSSTYVAVNPYGGKLGDQFVYLGTNKVPAFCYLGDWAYQSSDLSIAWIHPTQCHCL